jgi:hypothetical protein
MKKAIILIVIIQLILTSCSSLKKENYKVVNSFLNDKYLIYLLGLKADDTILIASESQSTKSFSNFSLNFDYIKPDLIYKTNGIRWIDSTKKFNLDQINISHIRKQMQNQKPFNWNQNKIKSTNKIVVPRDSVLIKYAEYNEYKIKKSMFLFNISKPTYNIEKNISIFGFNAEKNFLRNGSTVRSCLVVMKKENGKWIYVGNVIGIINH